MKTHVFSWGAGTADGNGKMKEILGGKGAGLAEMSLAGIPFKGAPGIEPQCNYRKYDRFKNLPVSGIKRAVNENSLRGFRRNCLPPASGTR